MTTPGIPQLTPAQLNVAEPAQWDAAIRSALAKTRVAIPAIVQSVNYADSPPTVTVQIAIQEMVQTQKGLIDTTIHQIGKVPIILPSAGGFSLTLPVAAGDEGMLIFCDMCIDFWQQHGGVQKQFERRRHDLSDCGFAPGMRSQARPVINWSQNSAQLRSDDGSAYVEVAGGHIVNIVAPGGIHVTGPFSVTGNIAVTGALSITGDAAIDGVDIKTHTHLHGFNDNPTGPPI